MDKKKKILLVVTKGEVGGAQVFVYNLARGLQAKGHEVVVGFGQGKFLADKLAAAGIRSINFKNLCRSRNPLKAIFFIFELKKFCQEENFSVIHFNSSNALAGAVAAKLIKPRPKTIFTVHGLSMLDENYQASWLAKKVYYFYFKFFLSFIDQPVFVSRFNLERARAIRLVQEGDVAFNGLDNNDLKFLSRDQARNFLSEKIGERIGESDILLGSAGRLAYPKNYEFIIANFPAIKNNHPRAKLVLVGEGPERKKYEQLIKKLNLESSVYLAGEIVDSFRCLPAFDLFLLPSIYEGLSITLIEALFAKVPMIVSQVGGNEEIVPDKKCLYKLNDEKDFLTKLDYLLNNLKEYQCDNDFIKQFELERMVEIYERIYF